MKKMCKILKVVISLFLFFLPVKFYSENFYWEESKNISEGYACFPRTVTNGNANYVIWQEVDKKNENIFLSCRYFEKGEWKTNARFAGPFPYSGDIPDIYTASVSLKGIVSAAILANANEIHIFSSKDNAHSFSKVALESKSVVLVAPRIYSNCQNGFTLFTSFAKGENFHVNVSYSQDAISWSGFAEFGPTKSMRNSFMPVLFPLANKDYVVFQSQTLYEERLSYQLYLSTSLNHSNWSTPILLTGGDSFSLQENRDAFLYNNQRPTLCSFEEKLFMAWERSRLNSTNSDIWVLQVDQGGTTLTKAEKIGDGGSASSANIFSHNGKLSLTWFDTKRGVSTVRFAQKTGLIWNEIQLSHGNVEAVFPFPIVQNFSNEKNVLSFVWQESKDEKSSGIFFLTPDTSVLPPTVTPLTFAKGKRTKQKSAIFSVSLPNDSSGVSGYSWSFSKDRNVEPEHIVKNLPQDKTISVTAETDGEHYLKVCALDYAGNWSESAEEIFYLDLTSPTSPILDDYEKDDYGFVKTNTMSFAWRQNESDTDVVGYSYNLQYIAPIAPDMAENKTHTIAYSKDEVFSYIERLKLNYSSVKADHPPLRILGTEKTVSFQNRKNGLYVFSVSAIDEVGNVSVPSSCFLIFNKYLPETVVTSLKSSSDIFGNVSLEVFGSGFLYDGTISEIYISRNGKEPYDAVLSQSDGAFVVASD
ncbi:MAG: hypothetical protein IKI31_00785, partial [Treponema sp.]|nr:hypothetical protein [Treponema sp.]